MHSGLKNSELQTSSTSSIQGVKTYDAFGNLVASSGTWSGPFGYAGGFGYQEDATGLKLLGHRYYDSSTGRFLTRDPIKDGRNWYVYCGGNALTAFDIDGLTMIYIVGGMGVNFVAGGASGTIKIGYDPDTRHFGIKIGGGGGAGLGASADLSLGGGVDHSTGFGGNQYVNGQGGFPIPLIGKENSESLNLGAGPLGLGIPFSDGKIAGYELGYSYGVGTPTSIALNETEWSLDITDWINRIDSWIIKNIEVYYGVGLH